MSAFLAIKRRADEQGLAYRQAGRIEMSQQERDLPTIWQAGRLKVMSPVLSGERTQVEAARLLKRSIRQIRRLQRPLA